MAENFLTGILTIKDAIKGGFVIAEAILSVVPICNKIIINDAGSTDGTLELFYRLKEMYPDKIEILNIPDYESQHFELVDDVINTHILPSLDSEWVISLEGDTVWHEDNIFDLLTIMKTTECNSILQPGWDVQWCTKTAYKDFLSVRIVKNLPGLKITEGGGGFCINGQRYSNPKYAMSGVPPEHEIEYPRFHFPYLFPGNLLERARRHAEFLEVGNEYRRQNYLDLKKQLEGITFVKQNITPSKNLPSLVKGLAGEPYYYVREDLFNKNWLKELTGLDYGPC